MRIKHKVVEVPATATPAQIETALDNLGKNRWQLVMVFPLGTKSFAVFRRTVAL